MGGRWFPAYQGFLQERNRVAVRPSWQSGLMRFPWFWHYMSPVVHCLFLLLSMWDAGWMWGGRKMERHCQLPLRWQRQPGYAVYSLLVTADKTSLAATCKQEVLGLTEFTDRVIQVQKSAARPEKMLILCCIPSTCRGNFFCSLKSEISHFSVFYYKKFAEMKDYCNGPFDMCASPISSLPGKHGLSKTDHASGVASHDKSSPQSVYAFKFNASLTQDSPFSGVLVWCCKIIV